MSKSRKLTPSKTVFERMRWDPDFVTDDVVVVYEDRFSGARERAFADYAPERVPWSRVVQFRRGELVLWDRRKRIDRIFGSGDTPADEVLSTRKARSQRASASLGFRAELVELRPYRYCRQIGTWRPVDDASVLSDIPSGAQASAPTSEAIPGGGIDILSYNVLHDLYDEGQLHSEMRVPLLLAALAEEPAAIICLQEITPNVARAILAEQWVRAHYFASTDEDASSVTPYGLLLLSRAPMQNLAILRTGQRVYGLLADIDGSAAGPMRVVVVHLTSDRHPRARTVRTRQIHNILDALADGEPTGDAVVVGDFNFGDEHVEPSLAKSQLSDLWPALHAGNPGFTFDPERNAIAQVNTISGQRRRLDRAFLQSVKRRARAIELFTPRDLDTGLPASDHFGLRATLVALRGDGDERGSDASVAVDLSPAKPNSPGGGEPEIATVGTMEPGDRLAALQPTHRSAVVIIPPAGVWPTIQAIRSVHDRSFERWMPHVNLLYGFVPDNHFAAAAPTLRAALADIRPFTVQLGELCSFHHKRSDTVWLRPKTEPGGALIDLHAALEGAFPQCDEQGKKSPAGFTPHLSVGQVRGSARRRIADLLARWQSGWQPVSFAVGAVWLISRRDDEPFQVRGAVPLGADSLATTVDAIRSLKRPATAADLMPIESVVDIVRSALAALAPPANDNDNGSWAVHIVGSARLYADGHDLDIAVTGPAPESDTGPLEPMCQALARREEVAVVRLVGKATVPIVRARIGGREVDIMYAGGGSEERVRGAIGVADWLGARAHEYGPHFAATVRAVRTLTHARAIDRQALGFPGGLSWALLVARAFALEPEPAPSLEHRFRQVIDALTDDLSADEDNNLSIEDGVLKLPSPVPPHENTTRALTRATWAHVVAELERAALMATEVEAGSQPWASLFDPIDRFRHPHFVIVEMTGRKAGDLRAVLGWLEGRTLGFVTDVAELPTCRPRPYPVVVTEPGSTSASVPAIGGTLRAHFVCGLDPRASGSSSHAPWQLPEAGIRAAADKLERAFGRFAERPSASTLKVRIVSRTDALDQLFPAPPKNP